MVAFAALLFDVDGTLADTERDGHRPAFNAAFAEAGLDWDWDVDLYGQLLAVTGGKERMRYYLERWRPDWRGPADLDGFIAGLHRSKTRHFVDLLGEGRIPLRPGVLRLLREARAAGVRLGIATTTTPENVTALLANCGEPGVGDWFEVIAAGDVVPQKKPAPDIYTWALERMGLPGAACIALEDSDNGVRSALGAGLGAILVTESSYTVGQDFTGAALILDQFGEPGSPARVLGGAAAAAELVQGHLDLGAIERVFRHLHPGGAG
jgi:HAD superfamily hydrolase (TIGR01509 family)